MTEEAEIKRRTLQQNKCLHSYFQQLADELNAAGYDLRTTIKVPVAFTGHNVKELMAKPVMNALYPDKDSTAELSTQELQYLYEVLNNMTAEKFGISLQWPDRFNGGQCA